MARAGLRADAPPTSRITRTDAVRGWIEATTSLMRRMCSGVVPQQPPTIRAPASIARRAYSAM